MKPIWKDILTTSSNLLPEFNDKLLLDFRKNKMDEAVKYLDILFQETVNTLHDPRFTYLGYEEVSPDERIAYIKNKKINKKCYKIQQNTYTLLKFNFRFIDTVGSVYIYVPYMDQNVVWSDGVKYFPVFPIIDRGGLSCKSNEVVLKVMRAVVPFMRSQPIVFKTDKKIYRESVVSVKIYQNKSGSKKEYPPILLYHLNKKPFYEVMEMYNFTPGEIDLVSVYEPSPTHSYIKITDNIYLRVSDEALEDPYKRRVVVSYLACLKKWQNFDLRELLSSDMHYYKACLGKYITSTGTNGQLLHDHAIKHLDTTNTLLDQHIRYQLHKIGIHANDIYDLLYIIFYRIDEFINNYEPLNLYNKKLGSTEQLMADQVTTVYTKLFKLINNAKKGKPIDYRDISEWMTKTSTHEPKRLAGNLVLRQQASIYNDNWLIAIGGYRFRTSESLDSSRNKKGKGHRSTAKVLLKSHPSHLVVESIMCIPSSNVVVTGTINPYLDIDEEGNIITPAWAEELTHVFD